MSETTKMVPMSLVIPEWLGAGAVIDLQGRQLTFRQRRFQDGTTVYDCVDAEGCLRTVTRPRWPPPGSSAICRLTRVSSWPIAARMRRIGWRLMAQAYAEFAWKP